MLVCNQQTNILIVLQLIHLYSQENPNSFHLRYNTTPLLVCNQQTNILIVLQLIHLYSQENPNSFHLRYNIL
ncbi:MAG TPA: hypothetical protein PKE09_11445, partial [Chitinophagales bacterium]|nr:hypothetical protein [Chitinophagales bacterium]HNJ02391.1 hypothetical protein [Chitinophagales bacterium]